MRGASDGKTWHLEGDGHAAIEQRRERPAVAAARRALSDAEAKVSAHYLVAEDGQILRLVPEEKRAWHAGRSWWRGGAGGW